MFVFNKPAVARPRRGGVAAMSVAVAALALVTAACGNSDDSGSSSSGSSAAPVPMATGDLVSAQPTSLGTILVDGNGMTLYDFANDTNGQSACTQAACVAAWPPVKAPATLPASLSGVDAKLGETTRPDGTEQLTVAGHPVYTFAGDSKPGQTNGEGKELNGGLWFALSPAGDSVTNSSSNSSGQAPATNAPAQAPVAPSSPSQAPVAPSSPSQAPMAPSY